MPFPLLHPRRAAATASMGPTRMQDGTPRRAALPGMHGSAGGCRGSADARPAPGYPRYRRTRPAPAAPLIPFAEPAEALAMAPATLTINSRNYGSWSMRGWLLCRMAGLDFAGEVLPAGDPAPRAGLLLLSRRSSCPGSSTRA